MFNEKLKQRIKHLEKENRALRIKQFRVGDVVFINDGVRNPKTPFYLIKQFNCGMNYYVSEKEGASHIAEIPSNGVGVENISHDMPLHCGCCGKLVTQKIGTKQC